MLRIKEILKEKNLTQIYLAERLDRKKQQINDMVSGRVGVSLDMLQRIAEVLEVPMWQLFASPQEVSGNPDFVALVRMDGQTYTFDSLDALKEFCGQK